MGFSVNVSSVSAALYVRNGLMQSEGKWTRGLGCCHTAFNWDLIGARRLGHGNHDHMPVRGDVLRCMLSKSLQNPPQSRLTNTSLINLDAFAPSPL